MEIVDKVLKNEDNAKEPKQRDIYYNKDNKKYYIVTFLGFNEYNLYNLEDACMAYHNDMSLGELKEVISRSKYELVNNPRITIEGEIN